MANKTKKIRVQMQEIYQTYENDWLGEPITKTNVLTYHHIIKACDGGKISLKNGALITDSMHVIIHRMEYYDPELYLELQYWFKIINDLGKPLTEEIVEIMHVLKERMINVYNYNQYDYKPCKTKQERIKILELKY